MLVGVCVIDEVKRGRGEGLGREVWEEWGRGGGGRGTNLRDGRDAVVCGLEVFAQGEGLDV